MKERCNVRTNHAYPLYGGRGINVCDKWNDSFLSFLNDMGQPPTKKHEIDRIDNDGPYSSENCRWVTHRQNCNNTSRCVFIECNGERLTIAQWARRLNTNTSTIHARIKAGWATHKAVTKPVANSGPTPKQYTHQGTSLTIKEWSEKINIKYATLQSRIALGFSIEDAINHNLNKRRSQFKGSR